MTSQCTVRYTMTEDDGNGFTRITRLLTPKGNHLDAPSAAAPAMDRIYRAGAQGLSCWARNHRNDVRPLPMVRWLGGQDASADDRRVDDLVLQRCLVGPIIDLGCGPGRFTAALAQRHIAALGIDASEAAVAFTRRRGAVALQRDLFATLPAEGKWGHVLLADGNIGIGGDPIRVLRRAAELLAPDGTVIAELDPLTTMSREMLRWETHDLVGPWFPWSRVGVGALEQLARATGFQIADVTQVHSRIIAVLHRD